MRTEFGQLWDAGPDYLDTASYGLPPRAGWSALQSALEGWRQGTGRWEDWVLAVDESRELFARLVGTDASHVFACSAVCEVAGLVAASLPDSANVVVPVGEFTSVVYPWAAHADRGLKVTEAPLADLADHIGPETALVAFSLVQSADGSIADVDAIVAAARRHGALTFMDVTQAAGWLPVAADAVDVVACSTYKWLMATRGTAFGVVSPTVAERLRPINAGWFAAEDLHGSYYGLPPRLAGSARRFDTSPAWHCWVGTAATLGVVEQIGVAAINRHDVGLANRFREAMSLPPAASAIVSVRVDGASERLDRARIRGAVRDGALRLSFHAYNTEDDVDRAVSALRG